MKQMTEQTEFESQLEARWDAACEEPGFEKFVAWFDRNIGRAGGLRGIEEVLASWESGCSISGPNDEQGAHHPGRSGDPDVDYPDRPPYNTTEMFDVFDIAHAFLATLGTCDGTGGSEYTRVRLEWESYPQDRRPDPISFIADRSNVVPYGTSKYEPPTIAWEAIEARCAPPQWERTDMLEDLIGRLKAYERAHADANDEPVAEHDEADDA